MGIPQTITMTSSQRKIQLALIGLLLRGSVVDLFSIIGLNSLEAPINIIAIVLFLVGFIEIFKKEAKFIIASTLIFAFIWWLSLQFHPENIPYIKEEGGQFFIYSLPFLWFGYYFVKKKYYLELFFPVAKAKLILALVVQLAIIAGAKDIFKGDYQTAANSMIVGLIAVSYLAISQKKAIDMVLTVVGTLVLFAVGSRSSFVAVLFFWLAYYLSITSSKRSRVIMIIGLVLVVLIGFNPIIRVISSLAGSAGFSTHLSEALEGGAVFQDEQRDMLYAGFVSLIGQSPWGYGVMGDRYISYSSGIYWKPIYPHDFYLEILVNFGYVIGSIIALIFTYYFLH